MSRCTYNEDIVGCLGSELEELKMKLQNSSPDWIEDFIESRCSRCADIEE